jgi:hypothetical protein
LAVGRVIGSHQKYGCKFDINVTHDERRRVVAFMGEHVGVAAEEGEVESPVVEQGQKFGSRAWW